jgi:hypothetical protein
MSYRIVEVKRTRALPVAAVLARAQGDALIEWLEFALEAGYHPATGEARPRKGDGKPLGFRTGTLARGLRLQSAGSTKDSARFKVVPPASRSMLDEDRAELGGMSFLGRHEIITTRGRAAEPIAEATDIYMRSLRK